MGKEFVSCSFLLLLLVMRAPGNAAGKMEDAAGVIHTGNNVLRLPNVNSAQQTGDAEHVSNENHDVKHGHGHGHGHGHSSSHMGAGMADMDPSTMVVFRLNDLKVGERIPVYFPKIDTSKSFHFLPRQKADSIPFSSEALPYLLQFFSFSPDSPQAKAMEQTFEFCESKPPEGEIKFCATSLESLLDFARSVFGSDSQVEILKTTHIITKSSGPLVQNYTILEPKEIAAPKMIACHTLSYPYAVYYCHAPDSESTRVFKVSLGGDNGDEVDAASVCHMDTSQWDPDHAILRMLGVKPGSIEVCHFFPADHLVLVPGAHPSIIS